MSVRAYLVTQIIHNDEPTFNLMGDTKLVNFFQENAGIYENMSEGTGLTEIPVEVLKEAIAKTAELELEPFTVKALADDIDWARRMGEEYVRYYCL